MTNQDIASRAGFCVVQGGRDDRQHFYVWHNDVPAALGKERSKEAAWALAATLADFFAPRDPEAQLKADYADLGVSCGYIGNIYYGPVRDDRSFRVFTRLKPAIWREGVANTYSVQVFDVPRDHKGVWMDAVQFDTPAVRAQLDALRARVAKGELFVPKAAA